MGTAAAIELEIHQLLQTHGEPDAVADALTKKLNWSLLSGAEMESLCRFFVKCGFVATLAELLLKNLESGMMIPWPYFAEALFSAGTEFEPEVKKAFIEGAEEHRSLAELARSRKLDHFDDRLIVLHQTRAQELKSKLLQRKQEWLTELEVFRSQGLFDEEASLLKKLSRHFPGDREITRLSLMLKEKKALEALAGSPHLEPGARWQPHFASVDPETEKILKVIAEAMEKHLKKNPDMAFDFAIAHLMWENYKASQRFLERAPDSVARGWLKVHLLLAARRFVDVLEELPELELRDAANPDSTLEAIYYRAQALWGLNQKFSAIELLESLLANHPDYRAGAALLANWKEDFE